MSQASITTYFTSRKRIANDDILASKSKRPHISRIYEKKNQTVALQSDKLLPQEQYETPKEKPVASIEGKKTEVNTSEASVCATVETKDVFSSKKAIKNCATNNVTKSDKITLARQELSLGDIKKKLAGSSRLSELKATAEKLSRGIKQLKHAEDIKNLKQFKSLDVEVPISPSKKPHIQALLSPRKDESSKSEPRILMSPRKVVVSPIKSPTKVPAYIKHASLAQQSSSLPLPHQYRFLAELFRGMETVVSILHNRNEKITFAKLKPSVQEMLKRNFTEKHLAQIKHLVPDFYNFEVQKTNSSATSQNASYDLIVTPNFPNDIKAMNPSVLLERRRFFYDTLMQLVKKHHSQYLLTLDPPMVIPDDKLTRWHPEFELEKVTEIECAKLPELPNIQKYSTAQDVLSKARELFKCNTRMERALEKLSQAKARGLTDNEKAVTGIKESQDSGNTPAPSTSSVTLINPALRNLPTALLEKVKAKQAAKALEAMTRSKEQEQNYQVYTRLPDLARTLRNIFVTERKNVLALNIVLSKLDCSFKSYVSGTDLQRDIKILAEEAPDWIKLHEIRNTSYLKLDKNVDLKKIIAKLDAKAEKYKND